MTRAFIPGIAFAAALVNALAAPSPRVDITPGVVVLEAAAKSGGLLAAAGAAGALPAAGRRVDRVAAAGHPLQQ